MSNTTQEQRAASIAFLINAANYFMGAAQTPGAPPNVVIFANQLHTASTYMTQDGAQIATLEAAAIVMPASVQTILDTLAGLPTS